MKGTAGDVLYLDLDGVLHHENCFGTHGVERISMRRLNTRCSSKLSFYLRCLLLIRRSKSF